VFRVGDSNDWEVVRRRRRVTETGDPELVEGPPGSAWVGAAMVGLLLLMAVVSVGIVQAAGREARRPPVAQVQVPAQVGRPGEVAAAELNRRGFVVDLQPEPNIVVPAGTVVGQEPVAGSKLEQGSRVVLRVSSGPPGTRVPDVRGLPAAEAVRSLSNSGLGAEQRPVFNDRVRAGEVVASSPRQERLVLPGAVVVLSVSQGPEPRVVPQMVGREAAAAMADLARSGLAAGRVTVQATGSAPPGTVLSTNPPAGSSRPPRFPVAVVVSGPAEQVAVPDFVGLTRSAASVVARATELRLEVRTQLVAPGQPGAGRVVGQSLPPATPVPAGSTVTVTVAVDPTQGAGP
jgi:serine/threonine-protein kinase